MAHRIRSAVAPQVLNYAPAAPNRRTERIASAAAAVAIVTVLASGSIAWAMLMWHRR